MQEEVLAKKVAAKMAASMGEGMEKQTAEMGIRLEAHGVVPALQGEFLLSALAKHKPEPEDATGAGTGE